MVHFLSGTWEAAQDWTKAFEQLVAAPSALEMQRTLEQYLAVDPTDDLAVRPGVAGPALCCCRRETHPHFFVDNFNEKNENDIVFVGFFCVGRGPKMCQYFCIGPDLLSSAPVISRWVEVSPLKRPPPCGFSAKILKSDAFQKSELEKNLK